MPRCHKSDLVTNVRYVSVLYLLHAPLQAAASPSSLSWTSSIRDAADHPELINIFEIFLPQLLRYPNPADPLNGEAAALLMRDPKAYAKKVESYVERYAQAEDADQAGDGEEDEDGEGVGNSPRVKRGVPTMARAPPVNGNGNGHANGNGNGTTTNGNGNGNGHEHEDSGSEEEDGNMSDMGELSDGDEFMGEMDD